MIDLVIFDADGVLFDSTESNIAYYNAIFDLVGEPCLNEAEQRACIFYSAMQVFAMRASGDEGKIARMREAARDIDSTPFFKLLHPFSELRTFLLGLRPPYRLGLATNRSATIPAIIDYLGLSGVFDAIASARDGVPPKPAPDIVRLCIERGGVTPERAVYVGDSETDRIAAEAAGTHFIGLGERAPHFNQISNLRELPAMLSRLSTKSS
jgi:phosphoglycolate phosphatase